MTDVTPRADSPIGGDWTLLSYDQAGVAMPANPPTPVTATFAGGRVYGKSACNQYSAGSLVSGAAIEISMAISTMMFCPPPAMDIEQAYLANLARAATYSLESDRLTIFDTEGRTLLVFTPGIVAQSPAG